MLRRVGTPLPFILLALVAVVGLARVSFAVTPRCGDGIVQAGAGHNEPTGNGKIVKLLIDKTQSHGRLRLVASKAAAAH